MRRSTAPEINEKTFQKQVEQLASVLGWVYYHTFNSYRSVQGFPDLVLVSEQQRRTVFAELKSEKGKPTDKQVEWLRVLNAGAGELPVAALGLGGYRAGAERHNLSRRERPPFKRLKNAVWGRRQGMSRTEQTGQENRI